MTNSEWKKTMEKCLAYHQKYRALLKIAEDEYEKRFGYRPSDVDDDSWIDTFHYATDLKVSIKEITENAKIHNEVHN